MKTIKDEIVVTSAGMISREVYAVCDRNRNFYVQGSMGASLGIGIGLALSKPDMKVVVIIGDGEALMGLDTLVMLKKLQREAEKKGWENLPKIYDMKIANNIIVQTKFNLDLYILDNGCYQSTGGQKTISDAVNFRQLCYCKVIFVEKGGSDVPRIDIPHHKIRRRFMNAI